MSEIQNRKPRSADTREETKRAETWKPPVMFPTPPAHGDTVYHWVRTEHRGEPDKQNITKRLHQEHWVPVSINEYPELMLLPDPNSRFPDHIEISGLLLCRNSREYLRGRHEYYERLTRQQMESVDNSMFRQSDPRLKMFRPERTSRVTVGRKTPLEAPEEPQE